MRIDYSQIQTFQDCPRRYYNKMVLCLKKVTEDERDTPKNWGKSIHSALEAHYKGKGLDEVLKVFNDTFQPLEGDKVMTPIHGVELIKGYINYYGGNTNELGDNRMETVAVEVKDQYSIGNNEYVVKIDRVVKNNSGYWVMDHKSTQKSLYTFFNKFTPNMQVSGYVDYVIRKYGQCSGFIPNALYFGYRERAYKSEPAGFHYQFQRDIVNRTKEQIADFEQNVTYWCDKIQKAESDQYWGKNENQCIFCQFKELCSNIDDENIRETLYIKHNPKEYLDE